MSAPVTLGARILFVDDEEAIRRLFETYLTNEGFDVQGASTLSEAMSMLDADPPEVVIVDKNLPDGSGIEVLHACRERHPETEVIVLTGYPSLESAIDALRLGAFDYIVKPVLDLDLVSEKLRRALERRHLRKENRDLADQLADALATLQDSLADAQKAFDEKEMEQLRQCLQTAALATRRARNSQPRFEDTEMP